MLFAKSTGKLNALFLFMLILLFSIELSAAKHAMIISCRSGNSQLHKQNAENCRKLVTALENRGAKQIILFFDGGNSEQKNSNDIIRGKIIKSLNTLSTELTNQDQFYLFILGHANASPRRVSLATKEGRLSGKQLSSLLDKLKAKQFIFCLNTQSHGLMPLLAKKERMVLCATDTYGQLNPPYFSSFFINTWSQDKTGNLLEAAKKAGRLTTDFYNNNSLAVAENSQIYYNGKTISYPFNGSEQQWLTISPPCPAATAKGKPNLIPELAGIKIHPPSIESRTKLKNASQLAKDYPHHAAVYIKRNLDIRLQKDNSSQIVQNEYIYLNKDVAAEFFAIFRIPVVPGSISKINSARIIYPDASYDDMSDDCKQYKHQAIFSGLRKGCLIIRSAAINVPVPAQLPVYNKLIYLQTSFPVLSCKVDLITPPVSPLKFKLYNCNTNAQVTKNIYSQVTTLKFTNLSAYNRLPGDPERREICAHILLTTMKSWQDFTEWTQRMFHRAEKLDPQTKKFINNLVKNSPNDTDKIKRVYNYLCSLRYLTTPVGAAAFRPRPPGEVINTRYGDCKDKANALVIFARTLGIKAFHVLVNRKNVTDPDFPAWQFNHMIAYFPNLPGFPQGLWLDATDGSTPFGTLPPGDIGKIGMLIKDHSYEFKQIKVHNANSNLIEQNIVLKLSQSTLKGTVEVTFRGLPAYHIRQNTKRLSPRSLKYFISSYLNTILPGFKVIDFNFAGTMEKQSTPVRIKIDTLGKKWMLTPVRANMGALIFEKFITPERKYGISLNDNQQLQIIQNLTIKGSGQTKTKLECHKTNKYLSLNYSRTGLSHKFSLNLKQGRIIAKDYPEVKKMISDFKDKINGD
jgi:hypothetical protein